MFFPALLPMIPGMYAYRTIEALLSCLYHTQEDVFGHYFYLLAYNGLTCLFIILGMVAGATVPVFLFKNYRLRPHVSRIIPKFAIQWNYDS